MTTPPTHWLGAILLCSAAVQAPAQTYDFLHGGTRGLLPVLAQQSLEHDPRIAQGRAQWLSAQQDTEQARGGLWPQLQLVANTRSISTDSSADQGGTPAKLGAVLSYNLHDFGRLGHQIDARRLKADASEHELQQARLQTVNDTAVAYLNAARYDRLADLQRQHMGELDALVGKLKDIVLAFPGRRSELTQAQARLGQSQDKWRAYQLKSQEYRYLLNKLTGQAAGRTLSAAELPRLPALPLETLQLHAREQHPQLRALRMQSQSLLAESREVKAAQLPQIQAQFWKNANVNGVTNPATQLYLGASWTAFKGFAGEAQQASLQARTQATDERARQLLFDIEHQLQLADADNASMTLRQQELEQLVKLTDQVRKDYFDQWRDLGKRSLLEVLNAENDHLETRVALENTRADQLLNGLSMLHEAGLLADWLLVSDWQSTGNEAGRR